MRGAPVSAGELWPGRHYAYCRERDCTGCLPTDAALEQRPIIALWGEMLARCIAQTPATKTAAGALAAITEDGDHYREVSERFRGQRIAADYWGPPPVPARPVTASQADRQPPASSSNAKGGRRRYD